jgi:D-beta-D-heptose 7-phosphate kinase/D-beta-D-heptose 1-phosphate adenosyltransferase
MSILVIGDLIIDDYKIVDVNRVSPEAPCLIGLAQKEYIRLGGAANVAANIFQLDQSVCLVGQGQYDTFLPLLTEMGMPCLLYEGSHSIKTRFLDSKSHAQLFRYDIETIIPQDSRNDLQAYSSFIDSVDFKNHNICVIVDYMKGMIRYNDVKRMKGCKVNIVSTKNPQPHRILPKTARNRYQPTNILVVNEKEYSALKEVIGFQYAVRTEGDRGMSIFKFTKVAEDYYKPDLLTHIDGIKVDVFDVTGAGDTVTAVIAFCLDRFGFSEENLIRACRRANQEAAKVVTKSGTTVIQTNVLDLINF